MPISAVQLWAFGASALVFFLFLIRTASRRTTESGGRRDRRSQLGIAIQGVGFALASFGPIKPTLASSSAAGIAGAAAVLLLMGGAITLFVSSSRELGRNWSLVARTRSDHELVRTGPYAFVRHPIYLGMLLFLIALALALGHWLSLVPAVPVFIAGTAIRTRIEDKLLEESFGDTFRSYRRSTPALIPNPF